jgi:AcrR family transcriptional regulator
MIDAAEALFAEHGVDNVTMLDIARAAGQGNRNAPQYHFGDKAGIINAVLDKHSDLISLRRREMMDAIVTRGSPTLRDLVEAYVLPVALHVENNPNGLAFLLINSQLRTSGSFARLVVERAARYPEVIELTKKLGQAMSAANRAERESKILLIQTLVFHGLAGYYALGKAVRSKQFLATLCASVEAVLAAGG